MDHRALGVAALIDSPEGEALSLAACKAALGISSSDQDAIIQLAIDTSVSELDAADGGWLGRALLPQTWELRLPSFLHHRHCWDRYCYGAIVLPFPPLIDVVSVKYDDSAGIEQTLAKDTDFRIFGAGTLGKQAIAPLYNRHWPVARCDPEAVRIQFDCGYEQGLPKKLTQALVMSVRGLISAAANDPMLFEDRVEGIGSKRYQNNPAVAKIITETVDRLLSTLRVY